MKITAGFAALALLTACQPDQEAPPMSTLDNTPKAVPAQAETETETNGESKLLVLPFQPGSGGMAKLDEMAAEGKCNIRVDFGSYAMGIANGHYDALLTMLEREDAVAKMVQQNWGREGERTICIEVPDAAQRDSVLTKTEQLMAAMEETPQGPITITLGDAQ